MLSITTPTLFDAPIIGDVEPPRCRRCPLPARPSAPFCGGNKCTSQSRLCGHCGGAFVLGIDGAGTKYCSVKCKRSAYTIGKGVNSKHVPCAWCSTIGEVHVRERKSSWPYICSPCIEPIRYVVHILKAHHVTHERARCLSQDPACEICGTNLLIKIRERSHGQPKVLLVVDHDHSCCPVGTHSCGRCVRGLICRDCNTAAGLLADQPERAHALGEYLAAWARS